MSNLLKMSKQKLINISALAKEIHLIDKKGNPLTHVIRFWESKFTQLKPIKFSGNRRYYSKKIINRYKFVKYLLKEKGMTIDGAKKILKKNLNSLDDNHSTIIKNEYIKKILKQKANLLLKKIQSIKDGKKNSY